jgi:phosphoenolpyruvate-protein phosphotransferase (PTS system enzyme I)
MQRLKGLAVTQGAAIGQAVLLVNRGRAVRFPVPPERTEHEVQRLVSSRDRSRAQLESIKARISQGPASDLAPLFDAQLLILDDPAILGRSVALVRSEHVNAEWAVQRAFEEVEEVFESLEDPYFRERKGDVEDVVGRLRMNLRHGVVPRDLLRDVEGPFVLVADELSASMAAQIDWTRVRGFAMDAGSRTYHTAILARSLQIPAVVGLHDATARVIAGAEVAVDGLAGELIVDPTPEVVYEIGKRSQVRVPAIPVDLSHPPLTRDGVRIRIDANVDRPEDIEIALRQGAEGVGLFRSEVMLGTDSVHEVTEDTQFGVYRRMLEGMHPYRVTIRTFDLDEARPLGRETDRWMGESDRRRRPLGLRGIRLSLALPDLFKRQVRAILRAASHGQLRMLLPFVSRIEEVREARRLIAEVHAELAAGGVLVPPVPIGVMIEVPSAALTADLLAREVDFLAIGTNDLIQYALAVDRTDERVSELYQPLHPGLLRLLRLVRRAAARHQKPLSVCGEMASDPALLALLIGLGLTEFSMTANAIPAARQLVASSRADELTAVARRVLHLGTIAEIESYLDSTVKDAGSRVMVPRNG